MEWSDSRVEALMYHFPQLFLDDNVVIQSFQVAFYSYVCSM